MIRLFVQLQSPLRAHHCQKWTNLLGKTAAVVAIYHTKASGKLVAIMPSCGCLTSSDSFRPLLLRQIRQSLSQVIVEFATQLVDTCLWRDLYLLLIGLQTRCMAYLPKCCDGGRLVTVAAVATLTQTAA